MTVSFQIISNSFTEGKGKGKFVPVLNSALRHEDVWECGDIAPPFLTSALDKVFGQLHAPAALPPGKEPPVHVR
jgi:hypothetical protein